MNACSLNNLLKNFRVYHIKLWDIKGVIKSFQECKKKKKRKIDCQQNLE